MNNFFTWNKWKFVSCKCPNTWAQYGVLKFEQMDFTFGHLFKLMVEWQTVQTKIKLLLEQFDLHLQYLLKGICPNTWFYGNI